MQKKVKRICQSVILVGILFPPFSFAQNTNNEFTGKLIIPGTLMGCPSKDCKIIRYYAETAEVKIVGLDDSNKWYQVIANDDYGNKLNGWMYYSLFTQDFRKNFFSDKQQSQESTTSESTSTLAQKKDSQEKPVVSSFLFKNQYIRIGLLISLVVLLTIAVTFLLRRKVKIISRFFKKIVNLIKNKIGNFIRTFFLSLKKKNKKIFQHKSNKFILSKINFKQKSFVASLPIIFLIAVGFTGISYGAVEYSKVSGLVREFKQLTQEEKYSEANEKLVFAQNSWLVKNLRIKEQDIKNKIESNKKLNGDKSKYEQGVGEISNDNLQVAVDLLLEFSEDSFYYQKAQTKIEEAKRKMVEGELSGENTARIEAEGKKRVAEARAKQEEFEKKLKTQELADKEATEKMMNADNDRDGLTYREEQKLGTSDWNIDSDSDGINDKEDLHPAGGGRNLAQDFTWSYEGKNFEYKISILEDLYEYYKNQRRGPHGLVYVTVDDIYIKKIAEKLKTTAKENGYHGTSFLVSFIQSLPYVEDYYTSFDEYPKYPIETLIDRNGDCEDTSYLFASLVGAMNLGVALIEFNDHMGVGVNTVYEQSGYYFPIGNERYYYYETTGEGFVVGELPESYKHQSAKVMVVGQQGSQSVYPQYKKPCDSSLFSGYYTDGSNYYSDSQCNYQINCLPWSTYTLDTSLSNSKYYYNPLSEKTYHDSSCTQILVKGCYKSKSYSGYFYKSGVAWYNDSQCSQLYKSMICSYPSSYIYACTSEYSYSSKKSTCDYYASSRYLKDLAQDCYDGLDECRSDINEYQIKLDEYNSCFGSKEY